MKLREFLQHINCPVCNSELEISFGRRKQSISIDDTALSSSISISSLWRRNSQYIAEYRFELDTNLWSVDFRLKSDNKLLTAVPLSLIDSFKKLHDNSTNRNFYKSCNKCSRYMIESNLLNMTFDSKHSLGEIVSHCEWITLIDQLDTGCRLFKLTNQYYADRSLLWISRIENAEKAELIAKEDLIIHMVGRYNDCVVMPIIEITSQLTERLSKLLIFT